MNEITMKRDMVLIRKILLDIENHAPIWDGQGIELEIEGYTGVPPEKWRAS